MHFCFYIKQTARTYYEGAGAALNDRGAAINITISEGKPYVSKLRVSQFVVL